MVVEEGDEETRGVPVRTEDELLDLFAKIIHGDHRRRSTESLDGRRQDIEQRVIQCCVHAHQAVGVAAGGRVSADESRDVRLHVAVQHLAKGEKVFLADAQGELAYGIAEELRQVALQIPERVNSETVDVIAGDDILIRPDQKPLQIGICSHHLLQGIKVAHRVRSVWIGMPWRRKNWFC